MKTEKINKEITETGNRKINIGVRAYSELKLKLTDKAKALGISLSEYCENILATHEGLMEEINQLKIERDDSNQKNFGLMKVIKLIKIENENLSFTNADLEDALSKVNMIDFDSKIKQLTYENSLLKIENMNLKSSQQIYSDPRLIYLFNKVKGLNDIIITDKGQINITYNSPKDLLFALIYSFKI